MTFQGFELRSHSSVGPMRWMLSPYRVTLIMPWLFCLSKRFLGPRQCRQAFVFKPRTHVTGGFAEQKQGLVALFPASCGRYTEQGHPLVAPGEPLSSQPVGSLRHILPLLPWRYLATLTG